MKNKYIYLSHFLDQNTPTYGNRDRFRYEQKSFIDKGDSANSFSINFSTNHMGTHIDLPFHFYNSGKKISDVDPSFWIFKSVAIIDIPCVDNYVITTKDFEKHSIPADVEIILIRTGFEKFRNEEKFWQSNPGILPDVSNFIREKYPKVRAIGFDFISLTPYQNRAIGKEAHNEFLGHNNNFIAIIEDMHLSDCKSIISQLIMSPILIKNIDSSPVMILAKCESDNV